MFFRPIFQGPFDLVWSRCNLLIEHTVPMKIGDTCFAARDHVQQALVVPVALYEGLLQVLYLVKARRHPHHLVMDIGQGALRHPFPVNPVKLVA
ncbi:hypothetical protein D7Y36_07685 [Stenotrophomonas maltophilia]|nr:hypothetical protein [Stenotrophomonas maltophilia]